jgi:HK97 family phage major capsid protein
VAVSRKTANRFLLDDAAKMLARFMPGWSASRACWVMHPSVYSELLLMADATNLVFLPDARSAAPGQFFGLPVLTSEKLTALGLPRDVCLVNWEQYLIGDRRQVEVAYSEHTAFTTNQAAWRFVSRVDGQPWMRAPMTLSDGASTLSPFVYLS